MLKLPKLPETFGRHRARKRNLILMAAKCCCRGETMQIDRGRGRRAGAQGEQRLGREAGESGGGSGSRREKEGNWLRRFLCCECCLSVQSGAICWRLSACQCVCVCEQVQASRTAQQMCPATLSLPPYSCSYLVYCLSLPSSACIHLFICLPASSVCLFVCMRCMCVCVQHSRSSLSLTSLLPLERDRERLLCSALCRVPRSTLPVQCQCQLASLAMSLCLRRLYIF